MKKNYVQIQSKMTINVTSGLQCQNLTDKNSRLENKFRVSPDWPKLLITIKEGQHWYPSEIVDYKSLLVLKEKKILTIGDYTDELPDDDEKEEVIELKKKLQRTLNEIKLREKKDDVNGE